MNNLNCKTVQDLAPLYIDGLVSPESSELIEQHLHECNECNDMFARIKKEIAFTFNPTPKTSKKVLFYVYSIRLWYLICPLLALMLGYYNLNYLLRLYEGALILFSLICIYSQFFTSVNWGIDLEQYKLHKKAELKSKKKWGKFYTSPLSLCLPCILVIGVIEIPKIINYILSMK